MKGAVQLLKGLLPPEIMATLRNESTEAIKETKQWLVQKLSDRITVPGLGVEQKTIMLEQLVTIVVASYVDGTAIQFALLSEEDKLEMMQRKIA